MNTEILKKAIIERTIETSHGMRRGSTYHSPLNIVQATAVRDALAKGIYNNLLNGSLKESTSHYKVINNNLPDLLVFLIFMGLKFLNIIRLNKFVLIMLMKNYNKFSFN